jgi:hypothetical protein
MHEQKKNLQPKGYHPVWYIAKESKRQTAIQRPLGNGSAHARKAADAADAGEDLEAARDLDARLYGIHGVHGEALCESRDGPASQAFADDAQGVIATRRLGAGAAAARRTASSAPPRARQPRVRDPRRPGTERRCRRAVSRNVEHGWPSQDFRVDVLSSVLHPEHDVFPADKATHVWACTISSIWPWRLSHVANQMGD